MNESQKTRTFCKKLERAGAEVFAIVGSQMQQPGWPDRYIAHKLLPGGSAWVEFKMPTGKLSASQRQVGNRLRRRGVTAVVYFYDLQLLMDFEGNVLKKDLPMDTFVWLQGIAEYGPPRTGF